MSEKGSGDDMSIAMIADIPLIRALDMDAEKSESETNEPQEEKGDIDGRKRDISEMS
jgi:hypothetical protein